MIRNHLQMTSEGKGLCTEEPVHHVRPLETKFFCASLLHGPMSTFSRTDGAL
jgi:hypothetical protein